MEIYQARFWPNSAPFCLVILSIIEEAELRQSKDIVNDDQTVSDNTPIPIRLKQARKAAGISQARLGLRIGIDPSTASSRMNHYELGRHVPDYNTLKRMAEELGVPVAYFFCENSAFAELLCVLQKLPASRLKKLMDQLSRELADSDEKSAGPNP